MKHTKEYDTTARRSQIAERIRQARKLYGLTQTQAARMLGCSRIKMNRVEQGRTDLTALEIDRLARSLKIPVSYFFTVEGDFSHLGA